VQDRRQIAMWRFEQISFLLRKRLSSKEIRRFMKAMAKNSVAWPSGHLKPIGLSTLYRWLKLYKTNPVIESLYPKERSLGTKEGCIKTQWLDYSLTLLEEDSDRSLYILSGRIKDRFGLDSAPSVSSLYRGFRRNPRYIKIRKSRSKSKKLRVRFQAFAPHEIWHADAKSDFVCHFSDGSKEMFKTLTIIDDSSRYVLRSLIVKSESLSAAVATFRHAAGRYGLPYQFYADRGSAYDSDCFRKGLALLGIHRINTKPRNPSAHGKIEAWHRVLKKWFVNELKHQLVKDLKHLQELLDAFLDKLYHIHKHKELGKTPNEAFNQAISSRHASIERLREAFLIEKSVKTEKKTGNIRVSGKLFKVPEEFIPLNRTVRYAIDPEKEGQPLLILKDGIYQSLKPAIKITTIRKPILTNQNDQPVGSLTPLLVKYHNRDLPQAIAGFGLPEIYQLFSDALKRKIPSTEIESSLLVNWLKEKGPFEPRSLSAALSKAVEQLGSGRPLSQVIENINQRIIVKEKNNERSCQR